MLILNVLVATSVYFCLLSLSGPYMHLSLFILSEFFYFFPFPCCSFSLSLPIKRKNSLSVFLTLTVYPTSTVSIGLSLFSHSLACSLFSLPLSKLFSLRFFLFSLSVSIALRLLAFAQFQKDYLLCCITVYPPQC